MRSVLCQVCGPDTETLDRYNIRIQCVYRTLHIHVLYVCRTTFAACVSWVRLGCALSSVKSAGSTPKR